MPTSPLRIWTNALLSDSALAALRDGAATHELIFADAINPASPNSGPADPGCRNADIAFGQPEPQDVIQSNRLKWVHITSAGYTRYDRDDFRQAIGAHGVVVTNSSSVYDEPCAEHLLGMMLALARQLPQAAGDQLGRQWKTAPLRAGSHLLVGDSVLIVGFGAIGRRLAELLAPFRMNITAMRRTPRGDEPVRVLPISQVDELLGDADHVINILPAADDTDGFFNTARFARMKRGARFYNIGRGSTVDQTALRASLESGELAAAFLDVTSPEPLPPADPLWSTPNCHITPHTGGGHADELDRQVQHFLENLRRFQHDKPLLNRVLAG